MALSAFQLEAWTEYAVGITILSGRIALRVQQVGRRWSGDDYFAIASIIFLTGETAMLQLIGQWGSIVGMTDQKALLLSAADKTDIVRGAKADVAGWCLYITLIWCLKACMLFFYRRLTLDTFQRRLVLFAAAAWLASYLATIGVVLLRCLPFRRNWQIYPYPGDECGTPNQIFLTLVITNVTTDLLILYIPLPLLWIVKIPLARKIIYCLWLTTGIFVIVASLLRCILSIRYANEVDVSTIWAIRETFVGIICVNTPILGPWLVRKGSLLARTVSPPPDLNRRPRTAIITIGQRNMRLGRLKNDTLPTTNTTMTTNTTTGWTTITDDTDADDLVLQHMRAHCDDGRHGTPGYRRSISIYDDSYNDNRSSRSPSLTNDSSKLVSEPKKAQALPMSVNDVI